jgi:hypothetical protein
VAIREDPEKKKEYGDYLVQKYLAKLEIDDR